MEESAAQIQQSCVGTKPTAAQLQSLVMPLNQAQQDAAVAATRTASEPVEPVEPSTTRCSSSTADRGAVARSVTSDNGELGTGVSDDNPKPKRVGRCDEATKSDRHEGAGKTRSVLRH